MNALSSFDSDLDFDKILTSTLAQKISQFLQIKVEYLKANNLGGFFTDKDFNQIGPLKYAGFSGIDTTIYPILFGLGTTSLDCLKSGFKNLFSDETEGGINGPACYTQPDFASNIEIVLSKSTTSSIYYVEMLYNGQPLPLCQDSESPEKKCPLDDSLKIISRRLIAQDLNVFCFGN